MVDSNNRSTIPAFWLIVAPIWAAKESFFLVCSILDHNPFSPQELVYPEMSVPYNLQVANKETRLVRSLYNMKDKIRSQYRRLQLPLPPWLSDPRRLNIEMEPFEKCSRQTDYQFSVKLNLIRTPESVFFGLPDSLTKRSFSVMYFLLNYSILVSYLGQMLKFD